MINFTHAVSQSVSQRRQFLFGFLRASLLKRFDRRSCWWWISEKVLSINFRFLEDNLEKNVFQGIVSLTDMIQLTELSSALFKFVSYLILFFAPNWPSWTTRSTTIGIGIIVDLAKKHSKAACCKHLSVCLSQAQVRKKFKLLFCGSNKHRSLVRSSIIGRWFTIFLRPFLNPQHGSQFDFFTKLVFHFSGLLPVVISLL